MRYTIRELLYTLAELCQLLYMQEHNRSPKIILRLHNTAFRHAMLCRKVIGMPKKVTTRTFYGVYWHSIVAEAPLLCRIVSPRTICTEEQERAFNTIKEITKRTSNGHANHIIPNSLLRIQAENMTKEKPMPVISKHSIIGKYAETLPPPDNTSFAHSEINSNEYQAHLERISDFLLPGEGIWWHYDDEIMSIVFHDGKDEPNDRIQGPKLHHFRSSTFASERNYLKEQWIKCLESEVVLPTCKIKIFDENGDYVKEKVHLSALLNEEQVAIHDKVTNREPEEDEILEFSNEVGKQSCSNYTEAYVDDETDDDIPIRMAVLSAADNEVTEVILQSDDQSDLIHVVMPIQNVESSVNKSLMLSSTDDKRVSKEDMTPEVNLESKDITCASSKSKDINISKPNSKRDKICDDDRSASVSTPDLKPTSSGTPSYVCTIAERLSSIIGHTQNLKVFDKYRSKLKNDPQNSILIADYEKSLAIIQTNVVSIHRKLSTELHDWEKDFFCRHGQEPTIEDIREQKDKDKSFQKIQKCKQFLRHWKIKV